MTTNPPNTCPQCGALIPEDSAHGLCPRCVFAKALAPTADGGFAPYAPPSLESVRAAFPHLEVTGLIGSGGMGAVYKARQPQLDRFVALKILPAELASQPGFSERFQREAQALARLSHPHIVTVHDFGQAGGFYYLLMEFIDGVNLRQLLQAKRLTPKEALSIVPPICEALQCAHDHGIVHRDIKPENLLIDKAGMVKIADFGIAKMYSSPLAPREENSADANTKAPGTSETDLYRESPQFTSLSQMANMGTPDYAAPEQASGSADHRADIYSLGVVLYEMLTGERPTSKLEAPSKRVQVDIRIDEIVLRALEKSPELRFATAAEFRTQVEAAAAENGKSEPTARRAECDPFRASHALPLWLRSILGAVFFVCLLNFAGPHFTRLGNSPERTFTVGLSQPWLVVHSQLVDDTRSVRALSWNFRSSSFLSGIIAAVVAATLLFFRRFGRLHARWSGWISGIGSAAAVSPGIRFRLVEEREGRRVILWRGVLGAFLAVFALALIVGASSSLVTNGAPPFLIVVALAGIAAILTVGTSVRIRFKSVASSHSEPDDITGPPRYSRAAIVGACWVPVTFLSFVAVAMVSFQVRGDPASGPEWWQLAILIPALILGVTGPFGTTILGWVAVSQIRRSAGRILGLPLALFDGLLYPLGFLSGVLLLGSTTLARMFVDFYLNPSVIGHHNIDPPLHPKVAFWLSQNTGLTALLFIIAIVAANIFIVRAVLRAVRRDVSPASSETRATGNEIRVASISIFLALIASALGALAAMRSAGAWPAMALSMLFAGMSIFMALSVRRLDVGKCAMIIAALGTVIWPLVANTVSYSRTHPAAARHGVNFPTGAHISRSHHSIMVTHDQAETALHYVLYHEGDFSTSSSGSQNLETNTWLDEGTVKLKNGRTFGYRRESLYPDELNVNGTAYDLRKGRVIVLRDDGLSEQFRFFPPLTTARDPEAVKNLINFGEAQEDAAPPAGEVSFGPVIERVITHPADGTENYFLDLDSGDFVAAPENVFALLRNRFDKVTKTGRTDETIKNWAQTSGADLSLAFTSPDVTLALYGGAIVFPTLSFEAADARDVLRMVDDALQQQKSDAKAMPPLTMFNRHDLDRDGAFVFRTHEGGIGLLQIVSPSTEQDSVGLSMDASGQVVFDNKVTSFEALGEMLKQRLAENKNLTVFIHCDTKSVPQISLMAVSKFVRFCGVTNLLFTDDENPRSVKIRYKLIETEAAGTAGTSVPKKPKQSESLPEPRDGQTTPYQLVTKEAEDASASAMKPAAQNLVPQSAVESARIAFEAAKARYYAARGNQLSVVEAEQHLRWAEAMFAGDRASAAQAKRDGACERLTLIKVLQQVGRADIKEVAAIERELAEAEGLQYEQALNDLLEAKKEIELAGTQTGGAPEEQKRRNDALRTKIQSLEKQREELRAQLQSTAK